MKKTIAILASVGLAGAAWSDQSSAITTNAHPELERAGFAYVQPSREQQKTMDAALPALKLERKMGKACETIEDARALLWRSINIAGVSGATGTSASSSSALALIEAARRGEVAEQLRRSCTEYKGFFWFSRLDWAREDDRTFKSGFAVKKGTGEIYRWEEKKAQLSGGGNAASPRASP